jgi:RND family efflux transporter MFP subunit
MTKNETIQPSEENIAHPRAVRLGTGRRVIVAVIVIALCLAAVYVTGLIRRHGQQQLLRAKVEENSHAVLEVPVAIVKVAPSPLELVLPGTLEPISEAAIYARTDGYVRRRIADIGDQVVRGQILAEIESPELDQQLHEAEASLRKARAQLMQAKAQLEQARANAGMAEATAKRWRSLAAEGVISSQDDEDKQATLAARKADALAAEALVSSAGEAVAESEASLERLRQTGAFRQVRAPFAGIVTARNIDVGSLVTAGSSSSVRELYHVAQANPLRVQVNVPQGNVDAVRAGLPCELEIQEMPGKRFSAHVARSAGALDPATRTMLVEVQAANAGGRLLPGMYANVRFLLPLQNPPLLIPSNAVRTTNEGVRVARVGNDGKVHFQTISVGRDYGTQIEVLEGLKSGDKVVTTVTDELREGSIVKPIMPTPPAKNNSGGSGK